MKTKKDIEYRKVVLDKVFKLCNTQLEIYTDQFNLLHKNKKKRMTIENRCRSLSLEELFTKDDKTLEGDTTLEGDKEEIDDVSPIQQLEGDWEEFVNIQPIGSLKGDEEEIKEVKGLKTLTPKILLTRLPVLLEEIKAGIIHKTLKWDQTNTVSFALLYQHNKITKKLYKNWNNP